MSRILPTVLNSRVSQIYHFSDQIFIHISDVLVDVAIWSTVEPGIGITAASIATLRPVLQNILWRLGLAPPPSHVTTQPIGSGDGRPSGQYRLNRLRPSHRSEDLEAIQGSTSTTTTITASLSHKIKA
jgi:hypothetical protein